MTLAIPIRKFYHLEDLITMRHMDNMGKVMLATGLDRRLRLHHGDLHRLVLGRQVGILHGVEPHVRADGLVVLGADLLQYLIPLSTLWSRRLRPNVVFLFILSHHREHRHVV